METASFQERVSHYAGLLRNRENEPTSVRMRRQENRGQPIDDREFLDQLEALLGRDPKLGKCGPKPKDGKIIAPSL